MTERLTLCRLDPQPGVQSAISEMRNAAVTVRATDIQSAENSAATIHAFKGYAVTMATPYTRKQVYRNRLPTD
jgi:hypothetical protein